MTTKGRDDDHPLDLVLERIVSAEPDRVWRALTEPDLIARWFAPEPWSVARVAVDLRPGGEFTVVMASPDGVAMDGTPGCVLVVEPARRLVWTDALGPGFRPSAETFMTAEITLEPVAGGTRYRARVLHKDGADREKHEAMGFFDGWGTCAAQLEAVAKAL